MHNNIMAAGSRDCLPMLATGRYAQWKSRFLRDIDTRPNGDALRKCILKGPYTLTIVTTLVVPATEDSPAVPEQTTVETFMNMTPENRAHFESEKEAIHLILTGIGDEIYSTVNACQNRSRMWESIRKLQSRNNLKIATMQVNVQFLQQLQPEWSRFVTIIKQQHKLDEVSYHKLFDILKQYQKEVNELRAERMAKNANPLALVATAQTLQDSDLEQAQRDKDMQKNLALIAKYFKKIYKPTNNNLKTSSNTKNKNVDTTPRETVGGPVVQQSGIQCFNCKEFGHYAKECRKPKRVKDSTYHKEKMLLCKQVKKGVQLQAEQSDWLANMDEEIDEQELEAHYSYMEKIQEVPNVDSGTDTEPLEQVQSDTDDNVFANDIQHFEQSESISNTCAVETGDSNVIPDSPDMCDNDIQDDQNDVECDDEQTSRTLRESNIDYDKLERKLNETLGLLAQKEIDLKEGLKVKAYEISVVKEKHDELVKESLLTKSHYEGLVKEKTKVITDLKLKEEKDIDKMISMEN
ncbi:retrovirus-related pol polyprotein from transposon TNT 1-94 [Tanacetum coccineum]|uniref:Retrovirus-related pol polyprotein from transposon TNT 1-94 n=1 Tax=Tanacetum coccineum TaxID=301880 RepID=A0ABQ5C0G3_9ASTR